MVRIKLAGKYILDLEELYLEYPDLEPIVNDKIRLFRKNFNDTRLNNHALTKRMAGKYAFSITDDIRIVYQWSSKTTVRFLAIGPHNKVYSSGS